MLFAVLEYAAIAMLLCLVAWNYTRVRSVACKQELPQTWVPQDASCEGEAGAGTHEGAGTGAQTRDVRERMPGPKLSARIAAVLPWILLWAGALLAVTGISYSALFSGTAGLSALFTARSVVGICVLAASIVVFLVNKKRCIATNRRCLVFTVLALLYFALYLPFIHGEVFSTDELDNVIGGMCVAAGRDVYSGFHSQHTPLAYYAFGLYRLIGAATLTEYRLCFYLMLSVLWAAIFLRHAPKCSGFAAHARPANTANIAGYALILSPLLFIPLLSQGGPDYMASSTMLSEHFQAAGLALLLLEYWRYRKTDGLGLFDMACISFAIFLAVGTAFVSLFPILVIAFAVVVREARAVVTAFRIPADRPAARVRVRRFGVLLLVVLAPFAVLMCWYAVSGTLPDAVKGIWTVNVEIYPKYQSSGFGSSFAAVLLSPLFGLGDIAQSGYPLWVFGVLALDATCFAAALVRREFLLGIVNLAYVLLIPVRCWAADTATGNALSCFHASPWWTVSVIMFAAYAIPAIAGLAMRRRRIISASLTAVLLTAFFLTPLRVYFAASSVLFQDGFSIADFEKRNDDPDTWEYYVDRLVEDGGLIMDNTSHQTYFYTDTLPSACSCFTVWMYEAYHDEIFEDLEREKPKVIILNDEDGAWGYDISDYAADFVEYVDAHYTELADRCPGLYIRNEYVEEVELL